MHVQLQQVEFSAPETSHYLRLAIQLLEVRLREVDSDVPLVAPGTAGVSQAEANADGAGGGLEAKGRRPLRRTGRWFVTVLPRITLRQGEQVTVASIDGLRELIKRHGLTPHPRGDASMLLWQVKNRLRFTVESVPLTGAARGSLTGLGPVP
ncbi:MAG: hypothetical protein HYY31_01535 [Chloroflexi bacterium]|nr:hypothetical protein [Chloroflexota bacterium]